MQIANGNKKPTNNRIELNPIELTVDMTHGMMTKLKKIVDEKGG